MARPPMPVGTWGRISRRDLAAGGAVAQCRIRDLDGQVRQVKAHGRSKAEAERRLKQRLAERTLPGTGDGTLTEHTTIRELCAQWLEGRGDLRDKSRAIYHQSITTAIGPGVGGLRIRELTPARAGAFLDALTPGVEATARSVLRQALTLAVERGVIDHNPVAQLARRRTAAPEVQVLTAGELAEIRRQVAAWVDGWIAADGTRRKKPGQQRSPLVLWFFDLAIGTGLRTAEILAVRWGDLDLEASPPRMIVSGTVVTPTGRAPYRQDDTKTRSGRREVALPPFVVQTLAEMAMWRDDDDPYSPLFPAQDGGFMAGGSVQKEWRRCRRAIGAPGDRWGWVQWRTMRRTVATVIDRATGAEDAAAQLGHAGTAVTERHYIAARARSAPDLTQILETLAAD